MVRATYNNRFVRWRKAGIWDHALSEISKALGGDIVMIDSSCVRVHRHGDIETNIVQHVATSRPAALRIELMNGVGG